MNKKGVFFTLLSLVMSIVLVTFFSYEFEPKVDDEIVVIKSALESLNFLMLDVNDYYLPRALYISGYRALESMTWAQNQTGFFTDPRHRFEEALWNGTLHNVTINGSQTNLILPLMENNTLRYLLEKIKNITSQEFNVNMTYQKPHNITIEDEDAFELKITMKINYILNDSKLESEWNRTSRIVTYIDVYGLTEPLEFIISPNGSARHSINQYYGSIGNTSQFLSLYQSDIYYKSEKAPSFWNRMQNQIIPSECCGFERLIHPDQLPASINNDTNRSYVDYLFWKDILPDNEQFNCSGDNYTYIYTLDIPNIPAEFKIDFEHLESYNITHNASSICP